jgi:thymidylate synthase
MANEEILNNPEYPAPVLKINPEVKDFYEFTEDDFELIDYQSTKLNCKFEVAE